MADTEFEEFTDLLDELPQHFKAHINAECGFKILKNGVYFYQSQ